MRSKTERIGEIGNLLTEAVAVGNVAPYLVYGKWIAFGTRSVGMSVNSLIRVTIPLLRPVLVLVILLRGVELVRMFDFIFIMTLGGPATTTQTISYFIYMNGLQYFRVGYGAALAWMLALASFVFAKFYFDYTRREA